MKTLRNLLWTWALCLLLPVRADAGLTIEIT